MATIKTLPDGTPYAKDMTNEEWEKGIALGKMQSSDSEWTKETKDAEKIPYRLCIGNSAIPSKRKEDLLDYANSVLFGEKWRIVDSENKVVAMSEEKENMISDQYKLVVNGKPVATSLDKDALILQKENLYKNEECFIATMDGNVVWTSSVHSWNKPKPEVEPTATANTLLEQAAKHMRDRAATYDSDGQQERSIAKTVELFNILCGQAFIIRGAMCESQGWLFMALLKMVRSETKDAAHKDSIEDLIAYASLYGEARLAGK